MQTFRQLKQLTCKGTLWQIRLSEFLEWRMENGGFVKCCPSNLLFGSTLPPPSLRQSTVDTDSVWLGVRVGC
jgi:hypothetical protein